MISSQQAKYNVTERGGDATWGEICATKRPVEQRSHTTTNQHACAGNNSVCGSQLARVFPPVCTFHANKSPRYSRTSAFQCHQSHRTRTRVLRRGVEQEVLHLTAFVLLAGQVLLGMAAGEPGAITGYLLALTPSFCLAPFAFCGVQSRAPEADRGQTRASKHIDCWESVLC